METGKNRGCSCLMLFLLILIVSCSLLGFYISQNFDKWSQEKPIEGCPLSVMGIAGLVFIVIALLVIGFMSNRRETEEQRLYREENLGPVAMLIRWFNNESGFRLSLYFIVIPGALIIIGLVFYEWVQRSVFLNSPILSKWFWTLLIIGIYLLLFKLAIWFGKKMME